MIFKPSKHAVLYNELPAKCPECNNPVSPSTPTNSKKAHLSVLIGILATGAWLIMFFKFFYKGVPNSVYTKQVASAIIMNSWPAFLIGYLASKFPQVVHRKCIRCNWKKTYEIKLPDIPKR